MPNDSMDGGLMPPAFRLREARRRRRHDFIYHFILMAALYVALSVDGKPSSSAWPERLLVTRRWSALACRADDITPDGHDVVDYRLAMRTPGQLAASPLLNARISPIMVWPRFAATAADRSCLCFSPHAILSASALAAIR